MSGYERRYGEVGTFAYAADAVVAAEVFCSPGKSVLGGGCSGDVRHFNLLTSAPNGTYAWTCRWHNASAAASTADLVVFAICAAVAP